MKNILLPLVLTAGVLFSACNKEDGKVPGGEFGDPVDVIVNLINDTPTRGIEGTEPGVGDENKITHLEFFVFDSTGEELDPKVGNGKGYLKIETADLTHKLTVSSGTAKLFLVVANSTIGEPDDDDTFDDILEKITINTYPAVPDASDNPRKIPAKGFEMSGYNAVTIGEGSNNQVYIILLRTVSKINPPLLSSSTPVAFKTQEQLDEVWEAQWGVDLNTKITFGFKGYTVINGTPESDISFVGNQSRYYKNPKQDPWVLWDLKGNIGSDFLPDGQYNYNYTGPSTTNPTSWFLQPTEGPVYVYESMPTPKSGPGVSGYDSKTVISYIIEGTLTTDISGVPVATRYWRVDLTATDYFHIMRNCVYKVTINKISTPGYGTPEEAEENPIVPDPDETSADFFISVAQWDINKYETEM